MHENSYTAASVGAFGQWIWCRYAKRRSFPTALANNKDKLVKSNVPYIKPERVQSIE